MIICQDAEFDDDRKPAEGSAKASEGLTASREMRELRAKTLTHEGRRILEELFFENPYNPS